MIFKRPKIALALGGGAARGLAHLGVLRILEEERVPLDMIVGTSMGALVGAMYASHPSAERVIGHISRVINSQQFRETRIHQLRRSETNGDTGLFDGLAEKVQRGILYGTSMTRRSILNEEEVDSMVARLLDDIDVSQTAIPFGAVATNLRTGEASFFREGSIRKVVAASSAVPLAFPPVRLNGDEMLDGGLVSMVPVEQAWSMGADIVVAVNISARLSDYEELSRGYRILYRTMEITKNALLQQQLRCADAVLAPDVGRIHWADFTSWQTCLELGEEEALARIGELRSLVRRSRFRRKPVRAVS